MNPPQIRTNRKLKPPRAVIERIITEEADKAGIPADVLMSGKSIPHIGPIRGAAWLRILNETGCSVANLAKTLGADRSGVNRQIIRARRQAVGAEA